MARVINSPGVEIKEKDLSLYSPTLAGTAAYVVGFANQGPTDEVIKISNFSEFTNIYGLPTNAAERYFYHTVKGAFNSTIDLYVNRLPWGKNSGEGFGSLVGVLAYPVISLSSNSNYTSSVESNYDDKGNVTYIVGAPTQFTITKDQYYDFLNGEIDSSSYTWTNRYIKYSTEPAGLIYGSFYNAALSSSGTYSITLNAPVSSDVFDVILTGVGTDGVPISGVDSFTFSQDSSGQREGVLTLTTSTSTTSVVSTLTAYLTAAPDTSISGTIYNIETNIDTTDVNGSVERSPGQGINDLPNYGIVIFNDAQTTINNKYMGYYVGFADNTAINPANDFTSIQEIETVTTLASNSSNSSIDPSEYTTISRNRLSFALTATDAAGSNPALDSISEIMESKIVEYDTSDRSFDDTLNIGIFKLRQSTFLDDASMLAYSLEEGYNAAIGYDRQIYDQNGGLPVNFFMGNMVNEKSNNIHVIVNDNISKIRSNVVLNPDGTPVNKIRVYNSSIVGGVSSSIPNTTLGFNYQDGVSIISSKSSFNTADRLYAIGAFSDSFTDSTSTKDIGSLPNKLDRAIQKIHNDEVYDIDIIIEGGLGTIAANMSDTDTFYYEDITNSDIDDLRSTDPVLANKNALDKYMSIYNVFARVAGTQQDGGRGDLILVADPIRQILVTGMNNKITKKTDFIFNRDIYWALRHQFELINSSYTTVTTNWFKVYDDYSSKFVWVPSSGFTAALLASTDNQIGPWAAPAGFSRGLYRGIVDIAFSPNQRQRDDLYKINLNPIAQFQNQGIVLFGQKTMGRKPSAFDRINVRRMFLYIEKQAKKIAQYFVFEPNTIFTRSRVVNTLTPILERVKNAQGIYDYIIICDERNNTGDVIDNNELVCDIYIKPTKTAEFITLNFIATRTNTNFEELIGG